MHKYICTHFNAVHTQSCFLFVCSYLAGLLTKELMGSWSEVPVPGGFGAAGGPNDGWHQALHSLTQGYLRCAVGWGSAPMIRKRLDELQMSVQAVPSTK